MSKQAQQGNSTFIALLDDKGKLIAISAGAPPGVFKELRSVPSYVRKVLDGDQPVALSDYLHLGGDTPTLAFAQPIKGASGTRVLVTGFPPILLSTFLGQTLSTIVDITGGQAYILDSTGAVVASSDPNAAPGEPVGVPGLVDAVRRGGSGDFGSGDYFASRPIANSAWEVVSVAPQDEVFSSVIGWNRWTPWLIFAAFAAAAAAAFFLLWRLLRGAGELAEAHTQLDHTNQALQRRARELERSNAELDQFASIASHDLQEPLRKVQTFSERVSELDADRLSEKGRDYLRRSADAAGRMQLLIEDLLTFSRVATQKRPFVRTDLGQVAREVTSDLDATIQEANGSVEIGELPTPVVDELQMRQLFQNLISNAIKFRREGVDPVVRIEGEVHGADVEIRVSDNGTGFEPRYANRIFRVFERLHGRGEYAGTGIGLALCRKIAERHGGTVIAGSTPGEGSTFTVTLPMDHVDELGSAPSAPALERERETADV
jgi:signal transduction histidine kinase